jgi:hypothetical protein
MREIVLLGDRGDQRLGTVAASHADHVGAPRDGVLGQLEQIIAGLPGHTIPLTGRPSSRSRSDRVLAYADGRTACRP